MAGGEASEPKAEEPKPHLRDLERVRDKESMAGGGAPEPKADEPQPHPPKDQLPNISYGITSPPPRRTMTQFNPTEKMSSDEVADEIEIYLPYDSKRMTGYVGLVNNQPDEKAYTSALIQMLFHIPCFRKAVLEIPESIPIKSLFLCLESSKTVVSKETMSLSGSTLKKGLLEIFSSLNEKMKGTDVEGTIQKLFEGCYDRCKKAEDDNYSSRELFFCVDLDVEACTDIHASLVKRVNEGNIFTTFAPLLFFHLKKFDFTQQADKVNQRYEYPYEIDLGKFLSTDVDGTDQFTYKLKSVIVRSGGSDCDEKYILITSPTMEEDKWLKIDGESVNMVDRNRAFEEQYRGDEEGNAIMLLYAREACNENTLRVTKEEGNEVNKGKTRSITIKVINVEEDHHGRNKVLSFTVKTVLKFEAFLEAVADYYCVPSHRLRFFTDSDTSPQTLIRAKTTVTVAQAVGGSRNLFLRFNKSPGFTGICELCRIREPKDIEDCF